MRSLIVLVLLGCSSQKSADTSQPADVCSHEHSGRVTISVEAEPVVTSRAVASFADTTVSSRAPKCTTTIIGACTVTECLSADPTNTTCQAATVTVSAGTIDISGGAMPALSMSSDSKRGYAGISASGERWMPGDALHVKAEGSDVPAFDADLVFPSRVEITGPADYVAKKDPIELDWKNGVPLTWKPGVGKVWLHLLQGDVELRKRTDIECEADSAAGAFTIPKEALQLLEGTTMTTANAELQVAGRSKVDVKVGDYSVTVEALHREEPRKLLVSIVGVPIK
ncbi:MAG: hypothetical protein ACXWUG_02625 [Polyangiales bacterium]